LNLPEKEWYTVQEAAKRWGCSEDDVLHYIGTNKIRPSFILSGAECVLRNPLVRVMQGLESEVGKFSGLASPIDYDWHHRSEVIAADWECDLKYALLSYGQPVDMSPEVHVDFEYVYWMEVICTYLVHISDILITHTEAKRFETLCQDPSDSQQDTMIEKAQSKITPQDCYARLKSEGLDDPQIAKELKNQFTTITLYKIGKLIAPPSEKKRSADAFRKIGQRALNK
jgi:hypothetical protein